MIWNQLDYDLQQKVIDRIVTLLESEEDSNMQDGLIAAVHELEVWSNSPCQVLDIEEDPFCETGWPDP
jgi:hypothetical protein